MRVARKRFPAGWFGLVFGLSFGWLAPAPGHAQVLYGSIVGNITDSSGAAIPGILISITNKETNQVRRAVTNDSGAYSLLTVATGTYEIRAAKSGFQTLTNPEVLVALNGITRVDLVMPIGAVTESVQVTAAAADLQTDRSEVRTEITSRSLRELPAPPGRNYQHLFRTIPGFSPPANAHSAPGNPARALLYNVNGASASSNDVRIDGASQFSIFIPHVTAYVPALESIETVNVVTNSFDAEQGLAGGSAVNVQIKSGTNDLHGSAFWYHNDNNTKAKAFFLPAGQRRPKWVYNQFGGTAGGPIVRDKLFYFGSYESTLDRQYAFQLLTVPTAAIKSGDLAGSPTPIYDPATGDPRDGSGRLPFAGNILPTSRISGISRAIAGLTPLPNLPGQLTSNFFASDSFAFDRKTFDGKLNWNASEKLTIYGRVSALRFNMINPEAFGAIGGPPISSSGGAAGLGFGGTYGLTVAGTYVVSPAFIVDGNFGYTLRDAGVEQSRLDERVGLDILRIPGTNGPRRFEGGVPRFMITGFNNLGLDNAFQPYHHHEPQYNYIVNANWTKGAHNVRFGVNLSRQHLNHQQTEFAGASHGASGGFTFTGGPTQIRGGPSANQWNSYGAFLLGQPNTIGRILQVPDRYTTRASMQSLYARDQWQISRKLTLSYGLRWEYLPMPTRADRGMERYDFANNKMLVCGVGVVPRDCGVEISTKGFAPRLGLAYRVKDSFVIRAGYGITNDPYSLSRPHRTNHPILLALNVTAPDAFVAAGRLENGIPSIPVPDLGNGVIDVPHAVGVNSVPEKFTRGYIQSWNFTIQKQVGAGFTGQMGYVATRQTKQLGVLDLNAGQILGAGRSGQPYFPRFGRFARSAAVQPVASSKYDSLQGTLSRRFAAGTQVNLAYTLSKAIGLCGATNSDGTPCIQALGFDSLNRSLQAFDRTHNFQANLVAELPFGPGKRFANSRGFAGAVLGGWQVNGLFSAYSGTPFSVSADGASLNLPGSAQRADQVKPEVKKLGGVGRGQAYYDWTAFAPVTGVRFGSAGFNTLRGPQLVNLDLGVFRRFSISERFSLQFRAEAFNATNTPHFQNPSNNISNRRLTPDGSFREGVFEVTGVNAAGREGIDERVFRFGLRFSF